jgi:hypothetical protein
MGELRSTLSDELPLCAERYSPDAEQGRYIDSGHFPRSADADAPSRSHHKPSSEGRR